MKKKPRIWLARDTEDAIVPGVYNVCSAPPILDEEQAERAGTLTTVCCGIFERLAPKSCHLPPGGGSIEIEITIKKARRK
jgi:hypothetical protein